MSCFWPCWVRVRVRVGKRAGGLLWLMLGVLLWVPDGVEVEEIREDDRLHSQP